jgi:hypothetical protein
MGMPNSRAKARKVLGGPLSFRATTPCLSPSGKVSGTNLPPQSSIQDAARSTERPHSSLAAVIPPQNSSLLFPHPHLAAINRKNPKHRFGYYFFKKWNEME